MRKWRAEREAAIEQHTPSTFDQKLSTERSPEQKSRNSNGIPTRVRVLSRLRKRNKHLLGSHQRFYLCSRSAMSENISAASCWWFIFPVTLPHKLPSPARSFPAACTNNARVMIVAVKGVRVLLFKTFEIMTLV